MKVNSYTKVILTLIAILLGILLCRPLFISTPKRPIEKLYQNKLYDKK